MSATSTAVILAPILVLLAACAGDSGRAPASQTQVTAVDMTCGVQPITLEFRGDDLVVKVGDDSYSMGSTISASGARYQTPGDDTTWFWNKGDTATLMVNGQAWPQCLMTGALEKPFRARGNEPFWNLEANNGVLRLTRLSEEPGDPVAYQASTSDADTVTLASDEGGVTVHVSPGPCQDTMTGMPYPRQVIVELSSGERLSGCGGSPEQLLQGAQWQVTQMGGSVIDPSEQLTFNFFSDGRVAGRAACNRYNGEYSLDGEGFGIARVATTKMACPTPLMEREQQFVALLAQVRRFDVEADGTLRLLGDDDDLFQARLEGD